MDESEIITVNSEEGPDLIEWSNFPETNPHAHVEHVISIVCGNTRWHWALHDGYESEYFPTLFWKTTKFDDRDGTDVNALAKYMPVKAYHLFGGEKFNKVRSLEQVLHHISKKRVSFFHVYIVVSDESAIEGVSKAFAQLPCRIVRLQAKDFVSGSKVYTSVGVDRCANLYAAKKYYGSPSMVIDGGTALTWTGTDEKGEFKGGGISLGLGLRFSGLAEHTSNLPLLKIEKILKRLKECKTSQKPLETYATSTEDAILIGVLREVGMGLSSLVKEFGKNTRDYFAKNPVINSSDGDDVNEENKKNLDGKVVITGGDGEIIELLLGSQHSVVTTENNSNSSVEASESLVTVHKNLANHAIGLVLKQKHVAVNDTDALEKLRQDLLGLRVFDQSRRGIICNVKRGAAIHQDTFRIKYDDGEGGVIGVKALYEALVDFVKYGEHQSFPDLEDPARISKREDAKKAIETMEKFMEDLNKKVDEKKRPVEGNIEGERKRARDSLRDIVLGPKSPPTTENVSRKSNPSTAEKKTSFPEITENAIQKNPESYIERRVAKYFDTDLYFGTVTAFKKAETSDDEDYWHITYDDGDQEDYDLTDMVAQLKEYGLHSTADTRS